MAYKNLMIREEGKDGKAYWNKIGTLITGSNGKEYVKLFHIPNTLISVFEPKPKNESGTYQQAPQQQGQVQNINMDGVDF